MAHMIPLPRQCEHAHCPRFATHTVMQGNNNVGIYCMHHAQVLVDAYDAYVPEPA